MEILLSYTIYKTFLKIFKFYTEQLGQHLNIFNFLLKYCQPNYGIAQPNVGFVPVWTLACQLV